MAKYPLRLAAGVTIYRDNRGAGYRVRWTEQGERREAHRRRADDARRYADAVVERLTASLADATTGAVIDQWLDWGEHNKGWAVRTLSTYRADVAPLEALATVRFADLTPDVLQRELDKVSAPARARNMRAAWRAMCSWAVERDYATKSPMRTVTVPTVTKRSGVGQPEVTEDDVPPLAAIQAVSKQLDGTNRLLWDLAAGTGARWGELIALDADAVRPGRTLYLSRQVVDDRGHLQYADLKGRRNRSIVVPADLWDQLLELPDDGPWFTSSTGKLLRHSNHLGRVLVPAYKKAEAWDADRWSFHSLRHAWATRALAPVERGGFGLDVGTVSVQLGHSSPRVTLDVYVGALGSALDNLRSAMP